MSYNHFNVKLNKLHLFSLTWRTLRYIGIVISSFLLLITAYIHTGLHRPKNSGESPLPHDYWLQPANLNNQYPQLIGAENWTLDFIRIEGILRDVSTGNSGDLSINADTVNLLQRVTALLPKDMQDKEWQRLGFLIEKSLGEHTEKELTKLINAFYLYTQNKKSVLHKIKTALPDQKISLLKEFTTETRSIQVHYFGPKVAATLFDKLNKTNEYLNSRRIINMNKQLNFAQRKEKLSVLMKNYKKSLTGS